MANLKNQIEEKIRTNGFPCHKEAEISSIACMLIDPTCIEIAIESGVDGNDYFHDTRHKTIFDGIMELKYKDGVRPDLVLLRDKIKNKKPFKSYTLRDLVLFLAGLYNDQFLVSNFPQYLLILDDCRNRRQLIRDAIKGIDQAYDTATPIISNFATQKDKVEILSIRKCLENEPPPRRWVFQDFLPQGIVASLSGAGGTGKTKLKTYFAVSQASGVQIFQCFKPERARKVICWFGEDTEEVVWERLRCIVKSCENINPELLRENLIIYCEQARPLMELDYSKAICTSAYKWLRDKIIEHDPGLVILDPKSKFYGLPEDCNTSAAIWVTQMQKLIANDATILISHHVNKTGANSLESFSSRGASAFIDGCRWACNVKIMDAETGVKFGVDDHKAYIELLVTKSNYTMLPSEPLRFKHVGGGGLEQVYLEKTRQKYIAFKIQEILKSNPDKLLSANEIAKKKNGNFIRETLKNEFGKVPRNEIREAIDFGLRNKLLSVLEVQTDTRPKIAICCL